MKTLKLIGRYARLNLMSSMEYRASFLAAALGMAVSNSFFVFFWWVAFGKANAPIGGYDFQDVMFIWAVASSSFGVAHVLFAGASQLTRLIVTGELDAFLLQPKDPLVSLASARSDFTAWGDFAYGIVLMALTGQSARAWLFFIVGVITGALLTTGVEILAHTLTFYFGDANAAGGLALDFLINFSIYPAGIYPGAIRVIMSTVLPAMFITHVPLRLARGLNAWWVLGLMAFALIFLGAAYMFFYRGLKKYESGNLIITRL